MSFSGHSQYSTNPAAPTIGLLPFEIADTPQEPDGLCWVSSQTATPPLQEGDSSSINITNDTVETLEHSKTIIRKTSTHIIRTTILHFPALTISSCLIWLNTSKRFWFDFETDISIQTWVGNYQLTANNILQLLQIAAKAYELLVVLSLSTLALDLYRARLLGDGLPLGLITAGYRIGNFAYLFHPGFLRSFRSKSFILPIFVSLGTLVSLIIGPAAAILLVPSPGWWARQEAQKGLALHYAPKASTELSVASWGTTYNSCLDTPASWLLCPLSTVRLLQDWAGSRDSYSDSPNISSVFNPGAREKRRWLYSATTNNTEDSITVSTTVALDPLEALSYYSEFVDYRQAESSGPAKDYRISTSQFDKVFQPLTQVQCELWDWEDSQYALHHDSINATPFWPVKGLRCSDDPVCTGWQLRNDSQRRINTSFWDFDPYLDLFPIFRWVDVADAPLSAIVKFPYSKEMGGSDGAEQRWWLAACTFTSRWTPSVVTAQAHRSNMVEGNITQDSSWELHDELYSNGNWINVSSAWARSIDVGANSTSVSWRFAEEVERRPANHSVPLTALDSILSSTLVNFTTLNTRSTKRNDFTLRSEAFNAKDQMKRYIESLSSTLLVDAISRYDYSASGIVVVLEDTPHRLVFSMPATGGKHFDIFTITQPNATCALWESDQQPAKCSYSLESIRQNFLHDYTPWNFTVEQYGYGSGTPSGTLDFAFAMVCLYLAMMTTYFLSWLAETALCWLFNDHHVRSRSKYYRISGWSDLQDLVLFSLNSSVSDTSTRAGTGVKSPSHVWKERAMVRVKDSSKDLELVLNDNGNSKCAL